MDDTVALATDPTAPDATARAGGPAKASRDDLVATVAGWLRDARRVTVLSGAGISTDSGIPDFRGPSGVWTLNPGIERRQTLDHYVGDPALRSEVWDYCRERRGWDAEPNAGHRALVDLARSGRHVTVVTQNVDGLHQRAGTDPADVIEVHGSPAWVECLSCKGRTPIGDVLGRVEAGEPDPHCLVCGGILKPATIWFGQSLDPDVVAAAFTAARECDVFLAVGTTLSVMPVAATAAEAHRSGARLVILNAQPTMYDEAADIVLRGSISELLPRLVAASVDAPVEPRER